MIAWFYLDAFALIIDRHDTPVDAAISSRSMVISGMETTVAPQ
jgi:hypothetical protein